MSIDFWVELLGLYGFSTIRYFPVWRDANRIRQISLDVPHRLKPSGEIADTAKKRTAELPSDVEGTYHFQSSSPILEETSLQFDGICPNVLKVDFCSDKSTSGTQNKVRI